VFQSGVSRKTPGRYLATRKLETLHNIQVLPVCELEERAVKQKPYTPEEETMRYPASCRGLIHLSKTSLNHIESNWAASWGPTRPQQMM
jgi:hypothetical protein